MVYIASNNYQADAIKQPFALEAFALSAEICRFGIAAAVRCGCDRRLLEFRMQIAATRTKPTSNSFQPKSALDELLSS